MCKYPVHVCLGALAAILSMIFFFLCDMKAEERSIVENGQKGQREARRDSGGLIRTTYNDAYMKNVIGSLLCILTKHFKKCHSFHLKAVRIFSLYFLMSQKYIFL